ncbi:flagellar basal body P-ring formation chaperone FlgA [Halothiobacillus sp. 15-55-196]|uniref:flagellar basal body P-ring formation chaperone FlgA n=1 Tax=Halothiobacillus sp. 15-55-196 TaxID=1970382 RepID=UPI0025B909A1|nr:flagellar basal body P-ring formation chaperone FlgA [Halothiobacillus sp. 15-55-196]
MPIRPSHHSARLSIWQGQKPNAFIAFCLCAVWVCAQSAWAAGPEETAFQSRASIESAAQDFLETHYQTDTNTHFFINPIDPRLQLKQCDQPLQVRSNNLTVPRGGRITLKVSCEGANPWRIYVPARIQTMVNAISLARPLAPGATISAEDLTTTPVNANQQVSAYLTRPDEAIGQVVTRPMQAGQILTQQDLGIAKVIHRGDHVTVIAGTGNVSVSTEGVAQADAGVGQRIMVKNSRSGQLVEGFVRDANTVVIK